LCKRQHQEGSTVAVTIHQVAAAAGVSPGTVSRALTRPEKVAAPTRDRVLSAVRALGYVPNRAASALRAGRTRTIGLVVPDIANPYFAALTKGVADRARDHDLTVFVVDADEDPSMESERTRAVIAQADGIVLCSPRAPAEEVVVPTSVPVVVVNNELAGATCLASDAEGGIELALDHLHALGHRRIGYAGGPGRSWSDRHRRQALADARSRWPEMELIELGGFSPDVDGGIAAGGLVLASGATAVIAFNDAMAAGLMRRARELGIEVPNALSVVGFDDTPLARVVEPALTSVRTRPRELGRAAADALVALLSGVVDGPDPVPVPAELTVRASTAPEPSLLSRYPRS